MGIDMKIDDWLWVTLKTVAVASSIAMVGVVLKILADKVEDSNQTEIDNWVDERLAESLSKKINQPSSKILAAIRNSDASQIGNEINQILQSIDLLFSRKSSSQITMKLCILYKDDSDFSTTMRKDWDDLPASIRKKFIQTGSCSIRVSRDLFDI
jgi:uncharacterized lipoprotein YmbA